MNQADVSKLVSQLRIKVNPRLRKFRSPAGPEGRLNKLRKTVTALIKHERIELNYPRADEARMYAERLISDAIRYGDCHKTTMEMADYWLVEKQLVHKLFKLRGNPYPALVPNTNNNRNLIHNVLLDEAKKEYRQQKYSEIAAQIDSSQTEAVSVSKDVTEKSKECNT
ncbi:ribosomal protein l17 [Holotrichia oblita]|uniref:Ribosomal protein l17 n=1 Tax=Holotrichia oblita TaxID=644536 RepID=A0ACB9TAI5_HOLOL|nr:ribosomal protein l17 [Holotrichia oblita]